MLRPGLSAVAFFRFAFLLLRELLFRVVLKKEVEVEVTVVNQQGVQDIRVAAEAVVHHLQKAQLIQNNHEENNHDQKEVRQE